MADTELRDGRANKSGETEEEEKLWVLGLFQIRIKAIYIFCGNGGWSIVMLLMLLLMMMMMVMVKRCQTHSL